MTDTRYEQFVRDVTDFGNEILADAEALRGWAQFIEQEATDTSRIADGISAKRVDTETVGETHQLAKTMTGVSEQAIRYASAGDTTTRLARTSHDEAVATHQGIHEAVNASPASGIHDVDNDWLTQE
jgi:hypothetical protein